MKLSLHSVYREADPHFKSGFLDVLKELARLDRHEEHSLVDNAETADAVLVTEVQDHLDDWTFATLRRSPVLRRWRHKAYVYCDSDRPVCILPGLYPSVTRSLGQFRQQESFCYLGIQSFEGDAIFTQQPDLLYSFSGQLQNHPCRAALRHLEGNGEIVDTSGTYIFTAPPEKVRALKERYRQQVARSKFVLCPRGGGCSSYRLFETMAAGRVPVIISDEWVEPVGPDWANCSIRVNERDVRSIPKLLGNAESKYEQMRENVRKAYHEFFGRTSQFNSIGNAVQRLHGNRGPRRMSDCSRHFLTWTYAACRQLRRTARSAAGRAVRTLTRRARSSATP
jgi:hypothetical protein